MKLSDKETELIIQIANQKLTRNNLNHQSHLFDKIYRLWNDKKYDGWVVSLEDHNDNVTPSVVVFNSEIEAAVKFLCKLEHIKRNDSIVAKAFEMSPGDEIHALRLAVVGLAKSVKILEESNQAPAPLPPRRPATKIEVEAMGAICKLQDKLREAKINIQELKVQIKVQIKDMEEAQYD